MYLQHKKPRNLYCCLVENRFGALTRIVLTSINPLAPTTDPGDGMVFARNRRKLVRCSCQFPQIGLFLLVGPKRRRRKWRRGIRPWATVASLIYTSNCVNLLANYLSLQPEPTQRNVLSRQKIPKRRLDFPRDIPMSRLSSLCCRRRRYEALSFSLGLHR